MSITEAIELLKNYNGPLGLTLHKGASGELTQKVENAYGITLPDDFKTLYRVTDGFETVEDIFNMIPLAEVVDNKKDNSPLWIAEYMIYSDTWELEADPYNSNNYSIFNIDFDRGKILLTNSLAEFICRFLKGGVFGYGGLYAWADEIKARLFGNTDPNKIKPLLWVYRECLKRGLMTKQDVVGRADWIIATEDEPHYLFVEISLSHNLNELITVLDSINLTDDILNVRALFSVIYVKLLVDRIAARNVIAIIDTFFCDERFTEYERNTIMDLILESDYLYDGASNTKLNQQLDEHTKDFFTNYSAFNLYHSKNWGEINADLERKFESKTAG